MRLKTVPARQGALWVRQGFSVFFKYPLRFCGLFACFLFGVLLLQSIPWGGPLLALCAIPLVTQGFMIATRRAGEGQGSTPMVFLEPLRAEPARRKAMVQVGLAYAVCMLLVMALWAWVDGGAFAAVQKAMLNEKTTAEQMAQLLQNPRLAQGMLLAFSLMGLLSVPFWHAPALAHWGGQGWGRAIFFSCLACWRNKAAFVVYSLTGLAVLVAYTVISGAVLSLLGQTRLVGVTTTPVVLMFSTVFYASLYYTYADCFAEDEGDLPGAPPHGPAHEPVVG